MAKPSQATWGGRFQAGPAELMLAFSESVSFDKRLALFDIEASLAHAAMLRKVGILSAREHAAIRTGLKAIARDVSADRFKWETRLEDVHMNIEQALTVKVPAAAKLHTARSRNDQVATDIRLFLKHACAAVSERLHRLQVVLLDLAEANRKVLIPGYTHLQRAQPVSVAHHLLAYVEMLGRDNERFEIVADHANWCPLGCGALAGTTLPIDREYTATLLGFVDPKGKPRVTRNSMDSVADRDSLIEFANACSLTGVHLSRMAEDVVLWCSREFGFARISDAFATGSSLMPQKKNPDSFELIRGKSARLQGNLQTLLTMVKGLPLTYNRDLQEDKIPVFDSFDQVSACLEVATGSLEGMSFDSERCAAAVSDPVLLATDLADYLVEKGVPFRDAHHAVGALVGVAEAEGVALNAVSDEQAAQINDQLKGDWRGVFDLKNAMAKRRGTGMPGPVRVVAEIKRWRRLLGDR
ncbi:MAG: argininosuccinate lyase [Verrucomicrobia bacterium]|nr:MAG: argininosuccinate lyase [Verrucomicrobiota bacterium]